ncbi:MAG: hypothetical protein JXR44_03070 [Thiotrichales bacterium]|nr:hypothetical protein [Thiotrichales bacterium]
MPVTIFFALPRFSRLGLWLLIPVLSGCSSLPEPTNRAEQLDHFLKNAKQAPIFYYAHPLKLDTQLSSLKMDDTTLTLRSVYSGEPETLAAIDALKQAQPRLNQAPIVSKKRWQVPQSASKGQELVWFIDLQAQAKHSRFPRSLDHFQLHYRMVMNIVPLQQVLAGKATQTLSSTLWQQQCEYTVEDGKFYSVDEWAANQGQRIQQSLQQLYAHCAPNLAQKLSF